MEEIKTPMRVSGSTNDLQILLDCVSEYRQRTNPEVYENLYPVLKRWEYTIKQQLKDELFEQQNPK
jgi:hypothetical protein